jgi:hypothetical protein
VNGKVCSLRVFEDGVLSRIFGPKSERENCIRRSFISLFSSPDMMRMIKLKEDEVDSAYNMHGKNDKWVQKFGGKT